LIEDSKSNPDEQFSRILKTNIPQRSISPAALKSPAKSPK